MTRSKSKDYDYLHANSRIWEMERLLLTADSLDRMVDYKNNEDVIKALAEYGYELRSVEKGTDELEASISASRGRLFNELTAIAPDKRVVDIFKIKYDYHNIKVILKSSVTGDNPEPIMVNFGRFAPRNLRDRIIRDELSEFPVIMQKAIAEAKDILARTSDAQLTDVVLDRALHTEMAAIAVETRSDYLSGYVRMLIDAANLRTLVRSALMRKDAEFVRSSLIGGGDIKTSDIVSFGDLTASLSEGVYQNTKFKNAAAEGLSVIESGGSLTRFEKLCDDAVTEYIRKAHSVAFGEAPLIAFLAAKEAEVTAIRTIISGRLAGVPGGEIRGRLRDTYV